MKNKKINIAALLLLFALMAVSLTACTETADKTENAAITDTSVVTSAGDNSASITAAEPVTVKAAALKGPTAIGLVDFMKKADEGEISTNKYEFSIASAPDEVSASIAKGEIDIAAVPANLASALYSKTEGAVQVLGINTLGVLYICGQDASITDMTSLEGKTVYASGKGATPELVLNHLLSSAGVNTNIEWKSEHAECVAALLNDSEAVAMLPQPFATSAQIKNPAIVELIDLNAQWETMQAKNSAEDSEHSALITGVVVVRKAFATEHPEVIEEFLKYYNDSVTAINSSSDEAAQLVEAYGIVPANIAKAAIPKCNIVLITGSEMKAKLGEYLGVLHAQNPKSIGGKLPEADFYYGAE